MDVEIRAYKRRLKPGQRPPVITKCPSCGAEFDAAAGVARLRKHCDKCHQNPAKMRRVYQAAYRRAHRESRS